MLRGNKYFNEANIEVLNGFVSIQNVVSGNIKQGITEIEYPVGFNKNNCVVLSVGLALNESNLSYEASPIINRVGKSVTLDDINIKIVAQYDFSANPGAQSTYKFKIVLMKLPVPNTTGYVVGDVNMDGQITEADYNLVLAYDVGSKGLTDKQLFLADVNGNGVVNTIDALKILQMLQ